MSALRPLSGPNRIWLGKPNPVENDPYRRGACVVTLGSPPRSRARHPPASPIPSRVSPSPIARPARPAQGVLPRIEAGGPVLLGGTPTRPRFEPSPRQAAHTFSPEFAASEDVTP